MGGMSDASAEPDGFRLDNDSPLAGDAGITVSRQNRFRIVYARLSKAGTSRVEHGRTGSDA